MIETLKLLKINSAITVEITSLIILNVIVDLLNDEATISLLVFFI